MSGSTEPEYDTRWGRAWLAMVAALAAVGVVGIGVAWGVLTATYSAQASSLVLSVGKLVGGPAGIVSVEQPSKAADGSLYEHRVLRIGIGEARIEQLCATQQASMFGQTVTLRLALPAATVKGLSLDAEVASGNVAMTGNVSVNVNAADVNVPGLPAPLEGRPDDIGLAADGLILTGTVAKAQSGQLTSAALSGLSIKLELGTTECPAPGVNGTGR